MFFYSYLLSVPWPSAEGAWLDPACWKFSPKVATSCGKPQGWRFLDNGIESFGKHIGHAHPFLLLSNSLFLPRGHFFHCQAPVGHLSGKQGKLAEIISQM